MVARLPISGSDADQWGNILNEFLLVAHNANGTLRATAIPPGSASLHHVTLKTSNYTLAATDSIVLVNASGGTVTVTLPDAGASTRQYSVKKLDSSGNAVTVQPAGGQTIDDGPSATLNPQYASITVVSDGNNWFIL